MFRALLICVSLILISVVLFSCGRSVESFDPTQPYEVVAHCSVDNNDVWYVISSTADTLVEVIESSFNTDNIGGPHFISKDCAYLSIHSNASEYDQIYKVKWPSLDITYSYEVQKHGYFALDVSPDEDCFNLYTGLVDPHGIKPFYPIDPHVKQNLYFLNGQRCVYSYSNTDTMIVVDYSGNSWKESKIALKDPQNNKMYLLSACMDPKGENIYATFWKEDQTISKYILSSKDLSIIDNWYCNIERIVYMIPSPDGQSFFIGGIADDTGRYTVYKYNILDKTLNRLIDNDKRFCPLEFISPDGKYLYYIYSPAIEYGDHSLFKYNIETGQVTEIFDSPWIVSIYFRPLQQ